MVIRQIQISCPTCQKPEIRAIEVAKGYVSTYRCYNCNSVYDAEISHDFDNNRHWWIGKKRNPDFWNLENETIEEGLEIMERRQKEGIKDYLGTYVMEEIKESNSSNHEL